MIMALYPLSLLPDDSRVMSNNGLRLFASSQIVTIYLGSVLSLIYTVYSWCVALKGIYQVDTFDGLNVRDSGRRKIQRAERLTLREQINILFGSNDPLEIIDTFHYDQRPLPLKGLEWTFLQTEGGIATSDEEDDESSCLL